jgi:hypothetical protein
MVTELVCTFVTSRADGEGGAVLAPLTKPVQPLKKAVEQLRINALTAHTHPLTLFFTFVTFSGLVSAR